MTSKKSDSLEANKKKRDFKKTPEPEPAAADTQGNRFVIQEHQATTHHYDF